MHPPPENEFLGLAENGRLEERIAFARRIGNHRGDARRFEGALERLFRAQHGPEWGPGNNPSVTPPPAWRGMPTTGARKTFALLIEFQDRRHHNSLKAIEQMLYGKQGSGAPYESVAAYYDRASYHKLDLFGGTTLGWYLAPYARTAVKNSDAARDNLVKEALQYFHSQGFDFSKYDTDHDGIVDFFYVIWAGAATGWGTPWWPFTTVFDDWNFTLNGVRFWKYAWLWEAEQPGDPFDTTGAIHETGHGLGLPDYYDYKPAQGPPGGVGGLDMMDSAKYDHNCFSKWMLDWLTPTQVFENSRLLTLRPSGTSDDCVLMWHGRKHPALFSEFFMVQNRERVGNDVAIEGEGLLIWHVDARVTRGKFANNNSFTRHKLLRLMEADGLEEIQAGRPADAGDFFLPGMSFGAKTVPSSMGYRRRRSGVEVRDIHCRADGLSATFAVVGP